MTRFSMLGVLAGAAAFCGFGGAASAKTVIKTVSAVIAAQRQTITITGTGFGSQAPYSGVSTSTDVHVCLGGGACPGGGWEAGYAPDGDIVGLVVQSWTNTQIVISGFSGSYGQQYHLSNGDTIQFAVANPSGVNFSNGCTVTVGRGKGARC